MRILAGIALAGLIVAGCEEPNTFVPPPPPKVSVVQPIKKPVTEFIEFTGNTAATQTVELRARVEGYLDQVLFADGDRVTQGDLLFVIEKALYQADVDRANAALAEANADLALERATSDRIFQLLKTGDVSKQRADEATARLRKAQAEIQSANAALEQANINLGYTEVRAPFDGRIGRRLTDPGNLVGADEDTLIAEINQIDPIYAYFTINERDLLSITSRRQDSTPEGAARNRTQPLFLGLANEDGYPHKGYFDFAGISLDAATGTLLLRGIFENPGGKIFPGLFVRIRAPIETVDDALLVPQEAIGFDQQGEYVLAVNSDNIVERKSIELGALSDGMRAVNKGLTGDEWIVSVGLLRAVPGREVQPVKPGDKADAPAPS